MKRKDLLLMTHLRKNARETLTSISKKTKIPISTIYDRIKAFENGLIKKHTALLDFSQLGYNTKAAIMLKLNKKEHNQIRKYLMGSEHVNSFYKVNNGYDFLVEGVFKHIKELEDFLDAVESKFSVKTRDVYYIVDDIKREAFMADPQHLELMAG